MSPSDSRYCVVCTLPANTRDEGETCVVGPFFTQEAAVNWAYKMRNKNRAWSYRPDVMQQPLLEDQGGNGGDA